MSVCQINEIVEIEYVSYLINPKMKNSEWFWFLNFYFSLHFVKMFEYIKSYLKMSN